LTLKKDRVKILAFKKVTIVILPDGIRNVRQYKIPKIFIWLLFLFIISSGVFLSITFVDYYNIKKRAPKQAQLIKENKQKEAQIAALANKIDKINSKMVELKKFDNKLKVMVNLEPGEDNTQFLAIGGSDPTLMDQGYSIEKAHQKLVRLMHQSLDNLETEISVQTQEKADLFAFLESQKSMFACTPSIWPAKGWVSSRFGYRISPFTNEKEFHNGLDISARTGSPIIAPADGVVASIVKSYGFGVLLTVNHGYGLKTRYAHLSKVLVKKGQAVKRGEKIALVGNTGRSTGPHLHYEVHLKGVPVNPQRYILN
jgi:murein DD-endopeptidase MepM/ murein hydrolase activator NlpD